MKILNLLLLLILCSCLARTIVKKPSGKIHQKQNETIYKNILVFAQSGDWLVTRGYHASDNLVANATGVPLSHVAIFDKEKSQVIEADNSGVHTTSINDFIDKSYRVLIIRPRWQNNSNTQKVMENAYKLVGKDYDFLGTIGINLKDKYYCSELAVHIYKEWHSPKEKLPTVIKPSELYLFGKVLYDSLPRDEI